MATKSISLQDIADRAGVTPMTVSRALRGVTGVSRHKADEIRRLAEEMGYIKNPLVESLMRARATRRTLKSGFVIGWQGVTSAISKSLGEEGMYDYFAEAIEGARIECERRGFRLEVFGETDEVIRGLKRIIHSRGIQGLILGPRGKVVDGYDIKPPFPCPVIQVGKSREDHEHESVVYDAFHAMELCMDKLKEQGCRRIGFAETVGHSIRQEDRPLAAFYLHRGKSACPAWVSETVSDRTPESLHSYITENRIDGLVIGSQKVGKLIIKLNADIPFACMVTYHLDHCVSGISPAAHEVGAEAAKRLIDRLLDPQRLVPDGRIIHLRPHWHNGTSHLRR